MLGDGDGPVALVSAGIGVTPLLAMLEALAEQRSGREVWWIHGARDGAEHAFRAEARGHVARLENGRSHVRYSRPQPRDRPGLDHDDAGRLSGEAILAVGVPLHADFRLCGPTRFVADVSAQLIAAGVARERIDSESFGGAPASAHTPAPAPARTPAPAPARTPAPAPARAAAPAAGARAGAAQAQHAGGQAGPAVAFRARV